MLTCLASLSSKAFSQDTKSPPGIIESFERLLELHKDQFTKSRNDSQSRLNKLTSLTGLSEIKIDPQYIKSLVLHSDENFLRYAQQDECKFLSTLENNLLKTINPTSEDIVISFKNATGAIETASIHKDNFFADIYKMKCLSNRETSIVFNDENFEKTISQLNFKIPRNQNECTAIHNTWKADNNISHLCRIQQTIKRGNKRQSDFYKDKIPLVTRTYLDNLCGSLNDPKPFCELYLKDDVWNKIINSEQPVYKMSYKCQQLYNKKTPLTPQEIKNCATKLLADPKFCETRGNQDFLSNFPLQDCEQTSLALAQSKLITDYHDCPGNIDNEGLTNLHRIMNHFNPRPINSSRETCAGETNYSLAKLTFDIKNEKNWPLKICYLNRIDNKEACTIYIPGSRPDVALSEDKVIAKILYDHKGAPQKTTCSLVDSKVYNPLRSNYKFGCFIVFDAENCTALSCDKKVYWEEQEQKDIKFIGIPAFDYFPTSYLNERFSFLGMINELAQIQSRVMRNLTDSKFFLDTMPNGIIHGTGCAEDLLPEQFQRMTINQCQPMPFIIDGHLNKNGETWLVTRLAIDDLHTPRLILWPNIFNSVSAFQELHPLNTWTLQGIRK